MLLKYLLSSEQMLEGFVTGIPSTFSLDGNEQELCSSSSSLFQSQRSLKSQLKQKQSMLTIIFTGNKEEAK